MNNKLDIKFLKSQIEKIHKFFLRGDYDQVIQKTKILLKKDKTQVMFYNYIGLSYKQLGKLSEAEKIFLEGLRLFPSSTTSFTSALVYTAPPLDAITLAILGAITEAPPTG